MMPNDLIIIAENYGQFKYHYPFYIGARYLSEPLSLRGLQNPKVLLVGTYYKLKDWYEICEELRCIQADVRILGETVI